MLSFEQEDKHFNYRVAGVTLFDAHVLLHSCARDPFWSLPGGRPEWLEPSSATLKREMREELGADIEVGRLLWVVENFFRYEDKAYHELAFYYLMTFKTPLQFDPRQTFTAVEGGLELHFRWFPVHELDKLTLYPSFLKEGLRCPPEVPTHLVHDDT